MKSNLALGLMGAIAGALVTSFVLQFGSGRAKNIEAGLSSPLQLAQSRALTLTQERSAALSERLEAALTDQLGAPIRAAELRTPVASPSSPATAPSWDKLIASLDALRSALETESRRTEDAIRNGAPTAGESLRTIAERSASPNWLAIDSLVENWRVDKEAANHTQLFQTARELLRAYGMPTAVYRPKNGLRFVYRRHAEGGAGPAAYFKLQDEMVVQFYVEDEAGRDSP